MDDVSQRMRILDANLAFFGYSKLQAMENAGEGIAHEVNRRFGIGKRVAIFCGLGNNGGDGFVAARFLEEKDEVEVFLLGKASDIKTSEARRNWEVLQKLDVKKREAAKAGDLAKIPNNFDIILDAVFGTGVQPPLREPFSSAVKKMNSMKGKKIAVDIETPGFKPDLVLSLHVAKKKGAIVIDIGIPREFESLVGPGDVLALTRAKPESHKGENGKLLIIGGSGKYHGAPILAAKAASRFVDLVYFSSTKENNEIVKKMKAGITDVIVVGRAELPAMLKAKNGKAKIDAVLVGPGMGISKETKRITELVLRSRIPCVLDADALKAIRPAKLHSDCIVTPHAKEFEILFGTRDAAQKTVREMAEKYGGTILRKGPVDVISKAGVTKLNFTHNVGMTKGGTGDVLAGLCAAFLCKNGPFLSACSAAFVNGLAGNLLLDEVGEHFSASDLADALPHAMKRIEDYGRSV